MVTFEQCKYSPNFYAVRNIGALISYLATLKASNKVFIEDGTYYVHYSQLMPIAKLAWEKTGSVDYDQLPDAIKERIILVKDTWTKEAPKTSSLATKLKMSTAYTTLYLVPDAPIDVVKAVYKYLAKLHHPDTGGDAAKFNEITEAFELITRS